MAKARPWVQFSRAMTIPSADKSAPDAVAVLRDATHEVGVAASIALLVFAAELALATVPPGAEHDDGAKALAMAARVAAGQPVEPDDIANAMMLDDAGILITQQLAPRGKQADAWNAVASVLGYAAWHAYRHHGAHPNPVVENFSSPDALDFVVDSFAPLHDLDWESVARAAAYVREFGGSAEKGWGESLDVAELRSAAAS